MRSHIVPGRAAFRQRFFFTLGVIAALAGLALPHIASAQRLGPSGLDDAAAGSWTKLTNQPPFNTDSANLLTDGTVLVHQYNSNIWWKLTPDINGSYVNGTWAQMAAMQSGYAPLYFANAVLPDGRLIVEGGEYNNLSPVWTNQGAIYDPVANVWTQVNPPAGWANIGDSPGIVQPDGVFMMGQGGISSTKQVTFNASDLTWNAITNTGKTDTFSEEGFGLLPNGKILTIDCQNIPNSEIYDPATLKWTSAGNTGVVLPDAGSLEIGPQILRPDGNMVAFGALLIRPFTIPRPAHGRLQPISRAATTRPTVLPVYCRIATSSCRPAPAFSKATSPSTFMMESPSRRLRRQKVRAACNRGKRAP